MVTWLTHEAEANALLDRDPLALLIGMLLDQQVGMEKAFAGPKVIADRMPELGATFDARSIADADTERFVAVCSRAPSIHRFPGSMAKRVQEMCRQLVERHDGDPTGVWTHGDPDGREVLRRIQALPGFGQQKARIFLALLGKQRGLTAAGWREAAGPYGEDGVFRSVADVVSEETMLRVRATKKEAQAAAKAG